MCQGYTVQSCLQPWFANTFEEMQRSYKCVFALSYLHIYAITLTHRVAAEYKFSPKEYAEHTNCSSLFFLLPFNTALMIGELEKT